MTTSLHEASPRKGEWFILGASPILHGGLAFRELYLSHDNGHHLSGCCYLGLAVLSLSLLWLSWSHHRRRLRAVEGEPNINESSEALAITDDPSLRVLGMKQSVAPHLLPYLLEDGDAAADEISAIR